LKGNITQGANYLARGASLLKHPSLRLFVIIPLLVNILIFGSLIWIGLSYLSDLMDSLLGRVPEWLDFIGWILWPLIGLTVSLITGYLFTAVALIIASPFNALLAEKAEELITGRPVLGDDLESPAARDRRPLLGDEHDRIGDGNHDLVIGRPTVDRH